MDTIDPVRFVLAFFFVLGLLGLFAIALKYFKNSKNFSKKSFLPKSIIQKFEQNGRLDVLETRYIDAKSKLVLVKRDNVEHLLLVGDGKSMVVETGIKHEA